MTRVPRSDEVVDNLVVILAGLPALRKVMNELLLLLDDRRRFAL
jgi:hypothetical protein